MNENLITIGFSGHGIVVVEAAIMAGYSVLGYAEKNILEINPYNLKYLGDENQVNFEGWWMNCSFILGIGDNMARMKAAECIKSKGQKIKTITHPNSLVSELSQIGEGTFIARNAIINPLVSIGKYAIINTSAIVEHECKIQDGAHIAPGATLAGNVKIGYQVFIGANSTVKQGVEVGRNSIVGAGSVVLNDIPKDQIWAGNPAKRIR